MSPVSAPLCRRALFVLLLVVFALLFALPSPTLAQEPPPVHLPYVQFNPPPSVIAGQFTLKGGPAPDVLLEARDCSTGGVIAWTTSDAQGQYRMTVAPENRSINQTFVIVARGDLSPFPNGSIESLNSRCLPLLPGENVLQSFDLESMPLFSPADGKTVRMPFHIRFGARTNPAVGETYQVVAQFDQSNGEHSAALSEYLTEPNGDFRVSCVTPGDLFTSLEDLEWASIYVIVRTADSNWQAHGAAIRVRVTDISLCQ